MQSIPQSGRTLAAALAYAEKLNWPVFPLAPGSKLPYAGSHGHLEAATDLSKIRTYFSRDPAPNIGVRCSGFWVLDVDGEGGADWLHAVERQHGELPRTVRQNTPRRPGQHILFLNPTDGRKVVNRSGIAPGVDTRSADGYIVVAPSRTEHGQYHWDADHHPLETEISGAPEWLLGLATAPVSSQATAAPPDELAALLANGVDQGARNQTLARLAGYLLRRYADPYVTLELLRSWNATSCRPPLTEKEVLTIASSIARREHARREARG